MLGYVLYLIYTLDISISIKVTTDDKVIFASHDDELLKKAIKLLLLLI